MNAMETAAYDHRESVKNSAYPEQCKAVLLRLVDVMEDREYSQAETARRIKRGPTKKAVSTATVNQLLKGVYPSDPTPMCKAIEVFINIETGRSIFRDGGFVATRLYDRLIDLANIANTTQRFTVLHGGIMSGKSVCAEALLIHYTQANPVLMRAPGGDSYGGFIRRLAAILGVETRGNLSLVRENILAALDQSHLLIVDDFHAPLVNYSMNQGVRVFEFLLEINDLCRCGIVLIGATEGLTVLQDCPPFERFAERIFFERFAPDFLPAIDNDGETGGSEDLAKICRAFDLALPSADDAARCRDLVESYSVSRLFDVLRIARARAEKHGFKLGWGDVIQTNKDLLKLN